MRRLNYFNERYNITNAKKFNSTVCFEKNILDKCFNFAYEMAFGRIGEHRAYRSGGSKNRANGEIFIDSFQGKLAEYALWLELKRLGINSCEPDINTYGLGEWDDVDLDVNGIKISIKSTKYYGQLLLLECKDWNSDGIYIPNISKGSGKYDFITLIRTAPSGEDILKKQRLLYVRNNINREMLKSIILGRDNLWLYDIPGFITHNDLINIIRNRYIIPKGGLLGKTFTPMDADNYYVQAGDMRKVSELFDLLINNEMMIF